MDLFSPHENQGKFLFFFRESLASSGFRGPCNTGLVGIGTGGEYLDSPKARVSGAYRLSFGYSALLTAS